MGAAVKELSDAEVFGAPAPAKEMSDAEVFGSPAPAAGPSPPISGPNGWTEAAKPYVNSTPVGGLMKAFGQGFREASGPDKLGLSPENKKWLDGIGKGKWYEEPFKGFNEGVILPTAVDLDGMMRMFMGTYRGLQAAGVEAGLPRDIVSLPDAFAGSPGALGEIRMRSGLPKDAPVGRIDAPPSVPDVSEMQPGFDAFHGSPYSFDAFSTKHIGSGEGFQKYGPGLYFAENEGVAKGYQERLAPDRTPESDKGNIYQVRINIDQDRMLDWEKPLNEQSPYVQEALGRMSKIVQQKAGSIKPQSAFMLEHLDTTDIYDLRKQLAYDFDPITAAEMFSEAGIPGIKYLDQGSRDAGTGTRNFVVFNENDIQITHKNGEPIPTPQDKIAEAKDLGVIGPERSPITEGTPKEVAERVTSANADQPPGEKVTQELPGDKPNPWRERFDSFVGKIKTDGDAKQLLRDAADQNEEFIPARQGQIPLRQMMDLGDASGIDPAAINREGIGRLLQNDNQVRNAMQAMLTATEHVKDAAREVKADASPENLMKMQEALLRRDTWVEQVVGHRAEWGRTGNVFQEFQTNVKDAQSFNKFLKDKDLSPEKLKKLARAIGDMDGKKAATLLSNLNKPGAWDKFKYYWVNALISGPTTHAKYIIANAVYAAYEGVAVTSVAGAVGSVRRGIYGGTEGVYMGEAAQRTYGLIAGVPDAVKAAVAAVKTGMQTPLPGELAQSIIPKNNKNIFFQQRPIPGTLGAVIGAPSKVASGIHSFFNFLGYRASIEALAYRQAAKEGLKLNDDAFWQRRQAMVDAPTPEMMNSAIEDGYRATFITELGPAGKAMSNFVKATKVGQLIMPFTHIPLVILERAMEGGPLAFLDPETRATLAGKDYVYSDAFGNEKTKPFTEAKRDMAAARLVVGGAVGAWAVNQVLNDRMTGFGPNDPKERAQWMATGHQPYSIRIGDYWYSYNRFGPLGTMLGLHANLAQAIPYMKPDSEELFKAIAMTIHATGKLLEDEVGMQGFAGLVDTIEHPIEKGPRWLANQTGSLLPFSSMDRQVASSMDPYMRETKSVVDGLRYYIPMVREGLQPKRDWLGAPIANRGYGGDLPVPGLSSIIQHGDARPDPLALEMQALDLHPAKPMDRIGGVKLTPKLYDTYQATAGPLTRTQLEMYINQPGWHDIPLERRQEIFKSTIEGARETARVAVQMRYPQIILQGLAQTKARAEGVKPPKMKDPSLIMNGPQGALGIRG
jgi:hypothetical protein